MKGVVADNEIGGMPGKGMLHNTNVGRVALMQHNLIRMGVEARTVQTLQRLGKLVGMQIFHGIKYES